MRWLTLVSVIVLVTGCGSSRSWRYAPETPSRSSVVVQASLGVLPLLDHRLDENWNQIFIYLLPIMPFGFQDLTTPEGVNMHILTSQWQWKPPEDVAKAIAEEIRAANIFDESFFTYRPKDAKLILEGRLLSSRYNGKILSYGLSAFGPLLWLVGFPSAVTSNDLSLDLAIRQPASGDVIWKGRYSEVHDSQVHWIYYTQPEFTYPDLLKRIMRHVVDDLRRSAPEIAAKAPIAHR